jgi:hypothetical protein
MSRVRVYPRVSRGFSRGYGYGYEIADPSKTRTRTRTRYSNAQLVLPQFVSQRDTTEYGYHCEPRVTFHFHHHKSCN